MARPRSNTLIPITRASAFADASQSYCLLEMLMSIAYGFRRPLDGFGGHLQIGE